MYEVPHLPIAILDAQTQDANQRWIKGSVGQMTNWILLNYFGVCRKSSKIPSIALWLSSVVTMTRDAFSENDKILFSLSFHCPGITLALISATRIAASHFLPSSDQIEKSLKLYVLDTRRQLGCSSSFFSNTLSADSVLSCAAVGSSTAALDCNFFHSRCRGSSAGVTVQHVTSRTNDRNAFLMFRPFTWIDAIVHRIGGYTP